MFLYRVSVCLSPIVYQCVCRRSWVASVCVSQDGACTLIESNNIYLDYFARLRSSTITERYNTWDVEAYMYIYMYIYMYKSLV